MSHNKLNAWVALLLVGAPLLASAQQIRISDAPQRALSSKLAHNTAIDFTTAAEDETPQPADGDVHVNPVIYGYSIDNHICDSWCEYQLSTSSDESTPHLIDGKKDTKWCFACNSWPLTITINNGEMISNYYPLIQIAMDNPYVLTHYQLTEGADTYVYPNRNWATWEVYGTNDWNDDDSWVLISKESDATKTLFRAEDDNTETQYTSTYEVDNTENAYKYYMFILCSIVAPEAENFYVAQMAELNLYGYNPKEVPGDITGDKKLDVNDLTSLEEIVLGKAPGNAAADINHDGKTDVNDVTTLIYLLNRK